MTNDPERKPLIDHDIFGGAHVPRPRRRRYSWQNDPSFSEGWAEAEYRGNNALDNFLGLPLLVYGGALLNAEQRGELVVFAYATWALALLIWSPWILFRLHGGPRHTTERAPGLLFMGALAWLPGVFSYFFGGVTALMVTFPLVYVWGGAMMLLALRTDPPKVSETDPARPPKGPVRAEWLLLGAVMSAAATLISVGVLVAVARGDIAEQRSAVFTAALMLGGLFATSAWRLVRALRRRKAQALAQA